MVNLRNFSNFKQGWDTLVFPYLKSGSCHREDGQVLMDTDCDKDTWARSRALASRWRRPAGEARWAGRVVRTQLFKSAHLPSASASKTLLNTWSPGKVKQTLTYTLYIYTNLPDFKNVSILINYNTVTPWICDYRGLCPAVDWMHTTLLKGSQKVSSSPALHPSTVSQRFCPSPSPHMCITTGKGVSTGQEEVLRDRPHSYNPDGRLWL